MPQLYCGSCWNGSRQPTPATWDIDGDLFCDAHKQSQGYDPSEGKRIGRADAIASATPAPPKSWDEFKERKRAKSELAAAASSDPEASPGSFGPAIKKAFLPKPAASHNGTAIVPRRTIALPETKGNSMEKLTCSVSGCAKRLNSANRSGRCSEHYYVPKTPRFTGGNYVCTVEGCKKKLRSDNRSGICKQHQERTGKPNGRPLTKPSAPPAKLIPNTAAHSNGHSAMATISVPASALESWWTKLALDDRAEVFSNWISRADA